MNAAVPTPAPSARPGGTDFESRVFFEECRKAATRAARAALEAVEQYYALQLPGMDGRPGGRVRISYAQQHSGAAPRPQDVLARTAAAAVVRGFLVDWGVDGGRIVIGGEEEGTVTLHEGDYIVRLDSLDGTTNSEDTFDNHAAVVLLDRVRVGDRGTRHMAGAIMSVTGWCTSWAQWSAYDDALARYRHVRGSVFVSNANWGVPEREVDERRGDRAHSAVAAVATSVERHAATVAVLERLGIVKPSAFYTVAGTPIAAALIGGRISMVVEPCAVSLHDSALLIPHQILGGVATTAGGAPLNPLAVYEQTADDLRPDAKPFTDGYIAWGGDVITAGVAVA